MTRTKLRTDETGGKNRAAECGVPYLIKSSTKWTMVSLQKKVLYITIYDFYWTLSTVWASVYIL